jgi:hypothetical protein
LHLFDKARHGQFFEVFVQDKRRRINCAWQQSQRQTGDGCAT